MSFFSRIKRKALNEFIDIIEWNDESSNTMIWRFPRYHAEIKDGAQLIVSETQLAVLVNEGRFADVYQPGRYELFTNNMPVLTRMKGWRYGFNSSFKVDVYFVNTKQFLNLRWGTQNPIMMRDSEFGPIRLRAFGSYCFRVDPDPVKFIRNVAGTDGNFTTDSVKEQLRNFVITKFTDYLAESKIAVLDLAANLSEFSSELTIALKDDFSEYGIGLTRFLIENISLPEAVEEALGKRTNMGVIDGMKMYTRMQFVDTIKDTAKNPTDGGSLSGEGMGAGIGLAMAGQMVRQIINPPNGKPASGQSFTGQSQNSPGFNFQHRASAHIPTQIYYIAVNGEKRGPFSEAQLQQMAQERQLTSSTLVWTQGMAAWLVARLVPPFSQWFGEVSPPW